MRCEDAIAFLAERALGEAGPGLGREIEEHLRSCPGCRAAESRHDEADALLRRALVTSKPQGLDERLIAAISLAREPGLDSHGKPSRIASPPFDRWTLVLGFLVVTAVLFLATTQWPVLARMPEIRVPGFDLEVQWALPRFPGAGLSLGWLVLSCLALQATGVSVLLARRGRTA